MSDCIFCKIASGEISCNKVYEDKDIFAFDDINPKGPVHVLFIPKKHYATLNDIPSQDLPIISKIFGVAQKIAKEKGVDQTGYRTLINTNRNSGQVVFHVHWHLIGGKPLGPMA
ncbi:MAG: histidine triad nucleotide-binding protein [Deltaproteobacteria bacterium RIFCSPLOWO2_01_44_7]|nr:MAG: histidine triad nucleotide-binding protein [Deltaproteobacteria bacterium RIFCSPHIGHO2_01_FULL_43_49]OGQ14465.1 MAG: histidine triad nucleotide-binding protein [Deltaproteobacteria bacterium RIFCSPHIGHO2_02_FULL_44_53]OGQ27846.1 MAG: histidine triad nucleotide-binding protein [Deltaproteobacteria bacterium RIFCSPHIGHO2_12_FULL_44_21]OGQ30922.1 MAG: histidine triad nucleotide-binding protein [Deltaproteobacteria bacterium RIFCSPLOWO2_01_FULL_45_74]OGQ41149.1 MAG: histidine triad nucleoti